MRLDELNLTTAVGTGAGMFGLWRASAFAEVNELDEWEDEVADDATLTRHIVDGEFVPINIGGDGAFQMTVRGVTRPDELDDRERRYRLVSSEPYLLVSDGALELGGLEAVGNYAAADKVDIPLDAGRYAVVVHLLDWQAEPGSQDDDGNPVSGALPDFVVEVAGEVAEGVTYRGSVETFERE